MKKTLMVILSTIFIASFTLFLASIMTGCSAFSPDEAQDDSIYLVLVNPSHQLPRGWEQKIELINAHDPWGGEVKVENVALRQFIKLQSALKDRGIDIYLDSAYRSVDEQIELWGYFQKLYGVEYCRQYVAVPGYSEHYTGLAIDVCISVDGEYTNDNDVMLSQVDLFREVHALMPEYGFILRYPEGQDGITGYSYEPWHLRYVGTKAAREIAERGITLEEYLSGRDRLHH